MAGRNSLRERARAGHARLALSLVVAALGCSTTPHPVAPSHEHWIPGYAFGVWGRGEVDVRDDCPTTGAASVRIGATWSTLLMSVLTLGIYTPHEVIVHCRTQS